MKDAFFTQENILINVLMFFRQAPIYGKKN